MCIIPNAIAAKVEYKTYDEREAEYNGLMEKSQKASKKATQFLNRKDYRMTNFYLNVSEGYRLKALKLGVTKGGI